MDRKARSDLHQRRSRITRRPGSTEAVEFFNVLTSAQVLETTESPRVFRSCPLITPKAACSSLQMLAIARAMAVLCA